MYAIHRILVAIKDPAEKSHPAVAKAATLARALDAQVQLFHGIADRVYSDMADMNGPGIEELETQRREGYRLLLEGIARPLRRRGITVTTAVEWDFPLHEAIIRNAMQFGANLIVAAGRTTTHHLPWLLRYTDWELLRCSPVPVLLVKNPQPWRHPNVLAAVDPTHAFAKPAALDGEILRYGATMAAALKGKIHAVHAYAPVPTSLPAQDLGVPGTLEKALAATQATAVRTLRQTVEPFGLSGAQLHVAGRHPADAIADFTRQTNAQIVVMGSISRSGLDRMIIGNTAETVIDQLGCDFLLVKPPYFHNTVARMARGPRVVTLPAVPGML